MTDLIVDFDSAPQGRSASLDSQVGERAKRAATVPGVRTVQLYSPLDVEHYVTMIETSGDAGLPQPAEERRTYQLLTETINEGYSAEASTHLQAVWMSVDDPEDFAAWYREEHLPLLFRVPGWLRCRRYELETGSGPEFLAVHDLAGPSVATDPIGDAARNTPWRDRVMEYKTAYERGNFEKVLSLP